MLAEGPPTCRSMTSSSMRRPCLAVPGRFRRGAQDARQVMLKHVLSGDSTPLREILDREGQLLEL